MIASVIIGIIALVCLLGTAVAALHIIRQSVSDAYRTLERIELRYDRSLNSVLDRLMTIKWEDFAAVKAIDESEEEPTGFIPPESQGEVEVDDGKWGHLSTLRERLRLTSEEDQLLREDFPEEMGAN